MHFCKAQIAVGGDARNTAVRDEYSPVSWPEVDLLRVIHGDEGIIEVEPFVSVNQNPRAERQRLAEIYGDAACRERWGGLAAPSELEAPGVKPFKAGVTWQNPLTHAIEVTGQDGETKSAELVSAEMPDIDIVQDMDGGEPVAVGDFGEDPPRERTAKGTFLPRNK